VDEITRRLDFGGEDVLQDAALSSIRLGGFESARFILTDELGDDSLPPAIRDRLSDLGKVLPLFQYSGLPEARVVVVEIDGISYVLSGNQIVRDAYLEGHSVEYIWFGEKALAEAEREALVAITPRPFPEEVEAYRDFMKNSPNDFSEEAWDHFVSELTSDKNGIRIVVQAKHMDDIIADGEIKNQHATGTSGGANGPRRRAMIENIMFGIDPNNHTDRADEFPVYGALQVKNDGYLRLSGYGEVAILLKDDVKNRATFVWGDTLDDNPRSSGRAEYWARFFSLDGDFTTVGAYDFQPPSRDPMIFMPSPIIDPQPHSILPYDSYRTMVSEKKEFWEMSNPTSKYFETQIHGGVSTSDIDYVLINRALYEMRFRAGRTDLDFNGFLKMLRDANISYKVYYEEGFHRFIDESYEQEWTAQ